MAGDSAAADTALPQGIVQLSAVLPSPAAVSAYVIRALEACRLGAQTATAQQLHAVQNVRLLWWQLLHSVSALLAAGV